MRTPMGLMDISAFVWLAERLIQSAHSMLLVLAGLKASREQRRWMAGRKYEYKNDDGKHIPNPFFLLVGSKYKWTGVQYIFRIFIFDVGLMFDTINAIFATFCVCVIFCLACWELHMYRCTMCASFIVCERMLWKHFFGLFHVDRTFGSEMIKEYINAQILYLYTNGLHFKGCAALFFDHTYMSRSVLMWTMIGKIWIAHAVQAQPNICTVQCVRQWAKWILI